MLEGSTSRVLIMIIVVIIIKFLLRNWGCQFFGPIVAPVLAWAGPMQCLMPMPMLSMDLVAMGPWAGWKRG